MTPDDQEKMRAEDEAYRRFGGHPDRRLTVAVQLLPFDGPLVDGSPAGVAQGAVLHSGGAR